MAKARILEANYYDPLHYCFSRTGTPCDYCVPLRAPREWMYVCQRRSVPLSAIPSVNFIGDLISSADASVMLIAVVDCLSYPY